MSDVRSFAFNYQTQTLLATYLPAEQSNSTILLVVNDSNNLNAYEISRKTILESWNFNVLLVGSNDSPTTTTDRLAKSQAVYICGTANDIALSASVSSMAAQPKGIVNEHPGLVDELGLAASTTNSSQTKITLEWIDHYLATGLTTGQLTIYGTAYPTYSLTSPSSDLFLVGSVTAGVPALGSLSPNKKTYLGANCTGRRVFLPWGSASFDPKKLKPEGLTLMKQSVEWATGMGADPILTENFGYETLLVNTDSQLKKQHGTRVSLPERGIVKKISAYIGGSSDDVRFAIYSDIAGEPGALLVQSNVVKTSASMAWISSSIPDTTLNAGNYWLCFCHSKATQNFACISSYPNGQTRLKNNDAIGNKFLTNWGSSNSTTTGALSIYATYFPTP